MRASVRRNRLLGRPFCVARPRATLAGGCATLGAMRPRDRPQPRRRRSGLRAGHGRGLARWTGVTWSSPPRWPCCAPAPAPCPVVTGGVLRRNGARRANGARKKGARERSPHAGSASPPGLTNERGPCRTPLPQPGARGRRAEKHRLLTVTALSRRPPAPRGVRTTNTRAPAPAGCRCHYAMPTGVGKRPVCTLFCVPSIRIIVDLFYTLKARRAGRRSRPDEPCRKNHGDP
jgi:hypothetical protein